MNIQSDISTFVSALFFGIIFIIISHRLRIPAIVILLIGGILLGPSALGIKLIDPSLLGSGLPAIIKLTVALILFEGGLTLDIKGFRRVSVEIKRALSLGVLITWLSSSIIIKLIFSFPWPFAILAGSLIIVTGPTVIVPLLKRINVNEKVHSYLHWEAVLIDPIGVFIALLAYEWIIGHDALLFLFFRLVIGSVIGILSGIILTKVINRGLISHEHLNVFILSYALLIYAVSDMIIQESGLLSIVIAGFVTGYRDTPQLEEIKIYKAQLTELLIGLLFILLAANLDIDSFKKYDTVRLVLAVTAVMLIIRPLNVFFSTMGRKELSLREKIFLSWIAPRGIVAASMASLFTLNIKLHGRPEYSSLNDFLEAFTYAVIIGTVVFQGFTAKWIGNRLGVLKQIPTGWLVIGAHRVAQIAARFINENGVSVTLIDTNMHNIKRARQYGLTALSADALTVDPDEHPELYGIGNVLAITKNDHLNQLVCQRWKKLLKNPELYRWKLLHAHDHSVENKEELNATGRPVWTSLELDKISTYNIEEDDFPVFTRELQERSIKHPERVLLFQKEDTLLPYVPDGFTGKCTCMVYMPFYVKLDINIRQEWIIYTASKSYREVLHELLIRLNLDFPRLNIENIEETIMKQEIEFSSVIGYATALPHAYIDGIDESLVLMAKTAKPVSCLFCHDDDVNFLFLVLSPKNKPDTHIRTLATISKLIMDEERRASLLKASSREDLINIFFPEGIE
ncbi:MAG: hypothetical protein CVV44_22910 [Spirochaetae bacterium HGW-Spirochaetae-1]|jgi:NhaP-type Na+/H+ or K+/H+ antiporter/mannitol/fructose-specific phosphotransferase system IIA component (Ntr-type)|nr:MAG: hypothetical protein CVV44_22910 [Spirochaetae bacterium HGW-Spirochaetae-1]